MSSRATARAPSGARHPRAGIGFLRESLAVARESLVSNKLRSGLMVLGIVIGITALVGMTSLIRGFDRSLRSVLAEMGPDTIYVMKLSGASILSGLDVMDLVRRPNLALADARAIARQASSVSAVDVWLGGSSVPRREPISYESRETTPMLIMGASDTFAEVSFAPLEAGRFFTSSEVGHRRRVVVLGKGPQLSLFRNVDPIGKKVRIGGEQFTVVGTLRERPNPAGLEMGLDDIAVIPYQRYASKYGVRTDVAPDTVMRDLTIVAIPRSAELRERAREEIEEIMRVRHGLTLRQPNDFDLLTQDNAIRIWERLTRVTFLALIIISSIALMVGGIGVMAVMTSSVTERTREIGVRKAVGAKDRHILLQFLIEASLLTSMGGLLGVVAGSAVGLLIRAIYDFPISLPWWSFALGLGVSAAVGIGFGTVPALRAARVDPIEALHYE